MSTTYVDTALDGQTRVPLLVGTAIAFSIASTLVVILRMYTRYAIIHAPGIDDYTMVGAAILAIGVSASTIVQAENGLGRHEWLVNAAETMAQLKALFAGEVLYNLSQILSKISFLLQYRRIFRDRTTRRVSLWIIGFLVLWGITQEFLVAFACIPVSIFIPSTAGICIESLVVWYLTSIMNIVTDFIIFSVPIPAVRNLQLPARQKFAVMSIFCLGFFTCTISIVRLFTLRAALNATDATWANAPTSYWTTIELNCGIMCASIATLRPLVRSLLPSHDPTAVDGNGSAASAASYRRHLVPLKAGSVGKSNSGAAARAAYPMRQDSLSESLSELKAASADATNGSLKSYEDVEAARPPSGLERHPVRSNGRFL